MIDKHNCRESSTNIELVIADNALQLSMSSAQAGQMLSFQSSLAWVLPRGLN